MSTIDFSFVPREECSNQEVLRKSHTYWQDAWRRLCCHKLAMTGLVGVVFIVLTAVFGPLFFQRSYSDQNLDFSNVPPRMDIYEIADDYYVYLTHDYKLLRISEKGEILHRLKLQDKDVVNKLYTYVDGEKSVELDFSYNLLPGKAADYDYTFSANGGPIISEKYKRVRNKTYPFGSDIVGRRNSHTGDLRCQNIPHHSLCRHHCQSSYRSDMGKYCRLGGGTG